MEKRGEFNISMVVHSLLRHMRDQLGRLGNHLRFKLLFAFFSDNMHTLEWNGSALGYKHWSFFFPLHSLCHLFVNSNFRIMRSMFI